jgi:hypothetical protein
VEDVLLQASEVVHDERLLPRIDEVETVGGSDQSEAGQGEQLAEPIRHPQDYILIQM